jgi:hypothetical protein
VDDHERERKLLALLDLGAELAETAPRDGAYDVLFVAAQRLAGAGDWHEAAVQRMLFALHESHDHDALKVRLVARAVEAAVRKQTASLARQSDEWTPATLLRRLRRIDPALGKLGADDVRGWISRHRRRDDSAPGKLSTSGIVARMLTAAQMCQYAPTDPLDEATKRVQAVLDADRHGEGST